MSKIQHIKHSDLDFAKWDQTILASPFPLVFAQSFYLNATFPGWDALIIGDYESVFPLTQKVKFGIPYLHQPSFTPQLGVYGKVNETTERLFYDYITSNYKLIEIELNASNTLRTKEHFPKTTYIINYKEGYKQNQNTKRNIAKAVEHKLIVEQIPANEIVKQSQTHLNPFLKSGLKLSPGAIDAFDRLLRASIEANSLFSFRVLDQDKKIQAIAHFIGNGKHTVYLKGINFDKETSLGSMHLLNSSAIQFFSTQSDLFDFGGGSKESLANFYKGFGAVPLHYTSFKFNRLPWLIKVLKNLS